MELHEVPICRALHRPNLVMGAEREPILLAAIAPTCLAFISFSIRMAIAGFIFWIISGFFFRIMAKYDPDLTKIWIRHINYQSYYPAKTGVWHITKSKMKG